MYFTWGVFQLKDVKKTTKPERAELILIQTKKLKQMSTMTLISFLGLSKLIPLRWFMPPTF